MHSTVQTKKKLKSNEGIPKGAQYCTENWEASFCIQISTALYIKMKENLALE